MEDNKKGNGIFLGIVGVATLIVAIIGASFAYFSAQAMSNEAAVNLTAYEFNASLVMQEIWTSNAKLIPVDPEGTVTGATTPNDTNLLYALNVAHSCNDTAGYKICALYSITVTNGGATPLTLEGKIITTSNEAADENHSAFSNLTYSPLTYSPPVGNNEYGTYAIGTAVTLDQTIDGETAIGTINVPANDSVTTYILIYLNENGDQSAEMGATYTGKIAYASTAGSGSQLTGTFTIGGGN